MSCLQDQMLLSSLPRYAMLPVRHDVCVVFAIFSRERHWGWLRFVCGVSATWIHSRVEEYYQFPAHLARDLVNRHGSYTVLRVRVYANAPAHPGTRAVLDPQRLARWITRRFSHSALCRERPLTTDWLAFGTLEKSSSTSRSSRLSAPLSFRGERWLRGISCQ